MQDDLEDGTDMSPVIDGKLRVTTCHALLFCRRQGVGVSPLATDIVTRP